MNLVHNCTDLFPGLPTAQVEYARIRGREKAYRIALNFRGSKFSRMVVFDNFATSLSKPCARRTRNVVWVWHTSKFYLIRTVTPLSALELAAVSKAMPTSKVSLWRASLVDSAACCPSTLLYMKTVVYVYKLFVEIILRTVENLRN